MTRGLGGRAQSVPRAHTRQAPRPRDERARGLCPSPSARRPPRYTRRSPPPRVGGCPRSCLTGGPAASASPAPADGPRRPTQGAGVPLVPVAVAEQVGAGGGRRRGDRRGRQPRAGGGGLEGEDWVAAGGTVSPSLRPPPRQPQPGAERVQRPQLRAERQDGPLPPQEITRPPPPAASPWRPTDRAARGQCVFLHRMLTLAKLPEIFSTKDLVLGW